MPGATDRGPPSSRRGTADAPVRAVFFDLDDTLFDHTRAVRSALAGLTRLHPELRGRTLDELAVEYQRLLDALHPRVLNHRLSYQEARAERFRRLAAWVGEPIDASTAREWSAESREIYQRSRHPVPGAKQLLQAVGARAVVGIISNNQREEQEEKLRALGMTGLVDFLLTSEEARSTKPQPRIFDIALDRASVEPGQAIMVGDSWPMDVVGAHGAGIPAVWFNRFGRDVPRGPPAYLLGSLRPARPVAERLVRRRLPPSAVT